MYSEIKIKKENGRYVFVERQWATKAKKGMYIDIVDKTNISTDVDAVKVAQAFADDWDLDWRDIQIVED